MRAIRLYVEIIQWGRTHVYQTLSATTLTFLSTDTCGLSFWNSAASMGAFMV